jgi:glutamine cyclotransferase
VVVGSFPTGLGGTSACALLDHEGERLLALSDFMRTRRTYVVRHEQALAQGGLQQSVVFSYRNEAFSQGLVWDGKSLLEAENKKGVDVINQMDVGRLVATGSARAATVRQIDAPGRGIEDLAWDGKWLYTSDETTFRFYRARWAP